MPTARATRSISRTAAPLPRNAPPHGPLVPQQPYPIVGVTDPQPRFCLQKPLEFVHTAPATSAGNFVAKMLTSTIRHRRVGHHRLRTHDVTTRITWGIDDGADAACRRGPEGHLDRGGTADHALLLHLRRLGLHGRRHGRPQ